MMTQVAQRGNITLPAELRGQYNIQSGDIFTIIPLGDDRFLLVRGQSQVDVVADRLRAKLAGRGATLEQMLESAKSLRNTAHAR